MMNSSVLCLPDCTSHVSQSLLRVHSFSASRSLCSVFHQPLCIGVRIAVSRRRRDVVRAAKGNGTSSAEENEDWKKVPNSLPELPGGNAEKLEAFRKALNDGSTDLLPELDRILDNEESKALLKDLAAAAARVSDAQKKMQEVAMQEQELAALKKEIELAAIMGADLAVAESEVGSLEKDVLEAEELVRQAGIALVEARSGNASSNSAQGTREMSPEEKDAERIESAKGATISALVGGLVNLPLLVTAKAAEGQDVFTIATLFSFASLVLSCALFGVCYRYIVRKDTGNFQLRGGAVGAFGLVRGLVQVDSALSSMSSSSDPLKEVLAAALNAGESVIIFAFCAAILDYSFRQGLVKSFPSFEC